MSESRITPARAEEGVREVARMMSDGTWQTGTSHEEVAVRFGVSVRTVETWAFTASRAIKIAIGDGDELRARLALMLERHERVAMSKVGVTMKGDEYPNPDVKAATAAVKTLAEVMGLVTQKHEHAHVVASYEQLPREGKAKWLREKAAQLFVEAFRLEGIDHRVVVLDADGNVIHVVVEGAVPALTA